MPSKPFVNVFILADKGGVRKTFLAIHLFRYLKGRGLAPKAVDADLTFSPLAKRLPPDDVVLLDIQDGQYQPGQAYGVDQVARMLESRVNAVYDCGANTSPIIHHIFHDLIHLEGELKRLGGKAVFIIPTDGEEKTDFQANQYIEMYGSWATVLVAKCLPGHHAKDIVTSIKLLRPDRSFTVPCLEPGLLMYYRQNRVSLDIIAANEGGRYGIEMPFYARSYLRLLNAQFDAIWPILDPLQP